MTESKSIGELPQSYTSISTTASVDWQSSDKEYRSIHVYVALCDNANQGIVPVPPQLGNGQDPNNNLYWGALYGVKTHLKKSADWKVLPTLPSSDPRILDRILFINHNEQVYLLAEAYDGAHIESCINDAMYSLSHNFQKTLVHNGDSLLFGDQADLIAYVGHNGLMEFDLDIDSVTIEADQIEGMILACASSQYFAEHFRAVNATPLLWTTSLMAPEAYVLEAALSSWIANGTGEEIKESAAHAYNAYQKCGINGARKLFKTGY